MSKGIETDCDRESHLGLILVMLSSGAVLWWLLGCERGQRKNTRRWDRDASPVIQVKLLDEDGIDLDGARVDLPTTVVRARAVGAADVVATVEARRDWIEKVSGVLLTAGVNVRLLDSR